MNKEKKIKDLDIFHKKLKFLILYSILCGLLIWGFFSGLTILYKYLFIDNLPLESDQIVILAIAAFALVMIYITIKKIIHLYYYFKFLFQMLLDDLKKMATILYGLTQKGHIVRVDNPKDIKEFLEKIGQKKSDNETLH